ncbi:cytochrome P450 [Xylogone sp. PMI_703]|nr:cytochrome P450 [Xylogone sp. PMI_703]
MLLPFILSILALIAVIGPFVGFWLDRKGLRSFPAPRYAALSSLWRIWHNLHYKHYLAVHNAHQQLGRHVRIAPNHISILDPQAAHEIYGHGANMMKEAWYDAGAGVHRNLPDSRDKKQHQAKRKMLAHAFAQKTIVDLEPLLVQTISTFMDTIDTFIVSGKEMNIRLYLNYFTIDLFGRILYSKHIGCLTRGDDLVDAETKDGVIYKTPFIQSLLDVTVLNTVLAMEPWLLPWTKPLFRNHRYKKAGNNFENIIYHNTKERLLKGTGQHDLFTRLLQDSKGNDSNLLPGEIMAECNSMMNAGTETTTAALTNTVYLLYTHPKVLFRLRRELDAVWPAEGIAKYDVISNIPYLRACIEESLRMRPASSMGLPRIVPEGGRVIAGKFVPEGVTVSVPTYSLLQSEAVFERASEYIPERWLTTDAEKKSAMMKAHLPFSTGPRACIGRNIAYFEQTLVIATLVRFFDLEVPAGFELETQERFNSNPGNLFVHCKRRSLEARI